MTVLPGARRGRAALLAALLTFALTVTLVLSPRAFAITQTAGRPTQCRLSLDSSTIGPAERHALAGAGFGPNQWVSIITPGEQATSVRTNSAGEFTLKIQVPAELPGRTWRVEAISQDRSCSAITSVAGKLPTTPAPAPQNQLVIAGFPAIAAVIVGAFLAACGLLFLTVGRRRRP